MRHWTLNQRRLYSSSQKLVSTASRVIIHRPYCHECQRSKSSHPDPVTININLSKDKKTIAQNLESQARYAQALVIWTDCDREGEHIGNEIVEAARKGKPGIQVLRARFSNVERAYVFMSPS
jgi:DNA topoisomerase IA